MESINPYAPTTLTSPAPIPIDRRSPKSKVTSMAVASRTIAGISLSGGLFGVGVAFFMLTVTGRFDPGMVLVAGIAFGVGIVIAAIAGFTTVSLLIGLFHLSRKNSDSDDPGGNPWTGKRVIFFSILCGAISGFASFVVPSGGAPESLIWGFLPAVVGAAGGYAMNRPCLRMLRKERLDRLAEASQSSAPTTGDPLAIETPSI